jgi:hypothetical protein
MGGICSMSGGKEKCTYFDYDKKLLGRNRLKYCDMTPESRNSGAREDVHFYATTR